jgi:hypothetical protein
LKPKRWLRTAPRWYWSVWKRVDDFTAWWRPKRCHRARR